MPYEKLEREMRLEFATLCLGSTVPAVCPNAIGT